jgi:hypothetical protein
MKKLTYLSIALIIAMLQSCYVMTPKSYNQISNNNAYNKGVDKFHSQSIQTQNLDSLYCNLGLFLETMSAYQSYFDEQKKNIEFSSTGIENVKKELIIMYNKYRSGNRTVFKSEIELRETIGRYIKAVIVDAKSGGKSYENQTMPQLLDGRPNTFKHRIK